jgi:hypothetical protein
MHNPLGGSSEMTVPLVEKWVELKVERSFNPLLSLNGEVRHVIDSTSPLLPLIDDPTHKLLLKTTISGLDSVFRKNFFATFVYSDEDEATGALHEEGATGAIKRGCRLRHYMHLKNEDGSTIDRESEDFDFADRISQNFSATSSSNGLDTPEDKPTENKSVIIVDLGKFHEYEPQEVSGRLGTDRSTFSDFSDYGGAVEQIEPESIPGVRTGVPGVQLQGDHLLSPAAAQRQRADI